MTVEELYNEIGGNYDEAIGRMMSDAFVERFIVKFLDDDTCANIMVSWSDHDEEATFKASHAAKGVCGNLALPELASLATEITEALRPGNEELRAKTDIDALVAEFEAKYRKTEQCIREFANASK